MGEWRTIESAPKDGTHILAWSKHRGPFEAVWPFPAQDEGDYWIDYHADQDARPTHWQPLPEPPKE